MKITASSVFVQVLIILWIMMTHKKNVIQFNLESKNLLLIFVCQNKKNVFDANRRFVAQDEASPGSDTDGLRESAA